MMFRKPFALLTATALFAACSPEPVPPAVSEPMISADSSVVEEAPAIEGIPAGMYRLDPTHASLIFSVNHLGFSNYTAGFSDFDALLEIDPEAPESATLSATVKVASLTLPKPPEGFLAELLGSDWLNGDAFPDITFQSTSIYQTSPTTARVDGELTFRGQTHPISFEATFIGGYAGMAGYDPNARIGFSATGRFDRSDFGMAIGLPPEGSMMGVGDEVTFRIDAEFTGPPLAEGAASEPLPQ